MMKRTVLIPQEICSITIMQRKVHAAQRLDTDVAAMEIGFTAALTACGLVSHPILGLQMSMETLVGRLRVTPLSVERGFNLSLVTISAVLSAPMNKSVRMTSSGVWTALASEPGWSVMG
jgi:hypothetical protein